MSTPSRIDGHGPMMTTEWSFPRSTLPPQRTSKQPWTRWALIVLGSVSIVCPPRFWVDSSLDLRRLFSV